MTKRSSLYDQPNSFGWISIGLHWGTALLLTLLWFVGMSISLQSADAIDARRSLHITIGLIAWLPLAGRIVWRLLKSHPRVPGQSLLTHRLARTAHYSMLGVLAIMLLSGPVMAWALPERTELAEVAFGFHSTAAKVLVALVLLHILAALKHLMFNDDETIARIFLPRKQD